MLGPYFSFRVFQSAMPLTLTRSPESMVTSSEACSFSPLRS